MARKLFVSLIVLALLVGVLVTACDVPPVPATPTPGEVDILAIRQRQAFNTREDSWSWNGADIILYSDDHVTEKIRLYGDSGNLVLAGTLAQTGVGTFSSQLQADNGLRVTQNITQVSGAAILNSLYVSGTLQSGAALSANTLSTTDAVTVGAGLDVVGALEVTGTVTLRAAASSYAPFVDTSGSFRVNDDVLITGTLGANGLATLGSASVTGALSANTLATVNAITVGAGLDVVGAVEITGTVDLRGVVSSSDNDLRINDNTIVTGNLTVSGSASYTSSDLAVPIANAGGDLGLNDNVLITGTVAVSSLLSPANGINNTGNLTSTGLITAAGGLSVAGTFTVTQPVIDDASSFRINDNLLVTGTVGVSSLQTNANGLAVTGGVTVTGYTTATTWTGMGSLYGAISSTVDYTSTQSIILNTVSPKLIVPFTSGGPGADMAASAISDGSYIGQLLILKNVDTTAGHTIVITAGENVDDTLTLDVDDSAILFWDGTDWRVIAVTDDSA